jgi:hypothetical protein
MSFTQSLAEILGGICVKRRLKLPPYYYKKDNGTEENIAIRK